jgi:hypothetical protein
MRTALAVPTALIVAVLLRGAPYLPRFEWQL